MEFSYAQELTLLLLFVIFISSLKLIRRKSETESNPKLPPGPPGLPIIGNLSQLGALPHRALRRLAQLYGPLMYLKLGQLPTVVVSSSEMAEEVLRTQDLYFCTRPDLSSLRKIYYGGLDIAFSPYNAYWRQARRICTSELLSASRVQLFRPIREQEVDAVVKAIRRRSSLPPSPSSSSSLVNLSEMSLCLLNNITCRLVFGRRFVMDSECGRSEFHDLVTEWTSLMGHFNIGEYFPSMEWINFFTGLHGRFKRNFQDIDAFLDKVIDAHLADPEDGVDVAHDHLTGVLFQLQRDSTMEIPLTKERIKAILMDLFIAGTDTGTLALEWGMSELMRNPSVRKKAQAEVREAIRGKEKVEESDLRNLRYLKLVVKEILRLHPPAPFLLPRVSRKDCNIHGHHIAANTRVTINVWAIARDPKRWENAEEFSPERFEGSSVDFRGQHFEFLPFGSGRRGCPGVSLGSAIVELALANLLYAFDWHLPEGIKDEELDMSESFGIVVRRKSPLYLAAVPYVKSEVAH